MTQLDFRPHPTPDDSGDDPLMRDSHGSGRRKVNRWILAGTAAVAGLGTAAVVALGGTPPAPARTATPAPQPGNSEVDVPPAAEVAVPRGEFVPVSATKERLAEECAIIEMPVGQPFGETCVFFTGGTTNTIVGPDKAGVEFIVEYAMKGIPNGDGTVQIPTTAVPLSFVPASGQPWGNGEPWVKFDAQPEFAQFEKQLSLAGETVSAAGYRIGGVVPCGDGAENVAVTAKTNIFLTPEDAEANKAAAESTIDMGGFDLGAICAAATAQRGGVDQSTQAVMEIDR